MSSGNEDHICLWNSHARKSVYTVISLFTHFPESRFMNRWYWFKLRHLFQTQLSKTMQLLLHVLNWARNPQKKLFNFEIDNCSSSLISFHAFPSFSWSIWVLYSSKSSLNLTCVASLSDKVDVIFNNICLLTSSSPSLTVLKPT